MANTMSNTERIAALEAEVKRLNEVLGDLAQPAKVSVSVRGYDAKWREFRERLLRQKGEGTTP